MPTAKLANVVRQTNAETREAVMASIEGHAGKALAALERGGVRKVMAVIGDSANAGSIGVHAALGFERVGVVKSCGWKFDRWLDIVLMEKTLGLGDSAAPVDPQGAA